jgi:hypothetical protein
VLLTIVGKIQPEGFYIVALCVTSDAVRDTANARVGARLERIETLLCHRRFLHSRQLSIIGFRFFGDLLDFCWCRFAPASIWIGNTEREMFDVRSLVDATFNAQPRKFSCCFTYTHGVYSLGLMRSHALPHGNRLAAASRFEKDQAGSANAVSSAAPEVEGCTYTFSM